LKPFDGSHGKYKVWASRLKDHFIKRNPDWQFLFTEIESHKFPFTKDNLKLGFLKTEQYTIDIDFAWTATTLWTFIGEHVVDSLYNIRNVLAGGHNNGLELWRALFVKHEGGADQVELSGMWSLYNFPHVESRSIATLGMEMAGDERYVRCWHLRCSPSIDVHQHLA
jgi:hypothetical protein